MSKEVLICKSNKETYCEDAFLKCCLISSVTDKLWSDKQYLIIIYWAQNVSYCSIMKMSKLVHDCIKLLKIFYLSKWFFVESLLPFCLTLYLNNILCSDTFWGAEQ